MALSTFLFSAYIYIGEDVKKYFENQASQQKDQLYETYNILLDTLRRYIIIEKRNQSFPEDIKNLQDEEKKMGAITVDYQNRKHRIDVTESILQKLKTVRTLEVEQENEYKKALKAYALRYIEEKLSQIPTEDKMNHIDLLIQDMPSGKGTEVYEQLIAQYLNEFLSYQYSSEELGVQSRLPSYLAKANADAH